MAVSMVMRLKRILIGLCVCGCSTWLMAMTDDRRPCIKMLQAKEKKRISMLRGLDGLVDDGLVADCCLVPSKRGLTALLNTRHPPPHHEAPSAAGTWAASPLTPSPTVLKRGKTAAGLGWRPDLRLHPADSPLRAPARGRLTARLTLTVPGEGRRAQQPQVTHDVQLGPLPACGPHVHCTYYRPFLQVPGASPGTVGS